MLAATVSARVEVGAAAATKTTTLIIEDVAWLLLLVPSASGGWSGRHVWFITGYGASSLRASSVQVGKAPTSEAGHGDGCREIGSRREARRPQFRVYGFEVPALVRRYIESELGVVPQPCLRLKPSALQSNEVLI